MAAAFAACLTLLAAINSQATPPDWARSGPPQSAVGLKNFPFDVSKGPPRVPPGLLARPRRPGTPNFVIVKFRDRFNADDRQRLAGRGIRFYGYVPVNAFLAKVPPGLEGRLEADPAVVFVGDYIPAYRLDSEPLGWAVRGETGTKKLVVQVFDDEPLGQVIAAVEGLGGKAQVYSDRPGLNGKFLNVQLDASGIGELAATDGVLWIEQETMPAPLNDRAASVTNAEEAWSQPSPLTGTGQVVAVCDTGLDTGNTSTLHADFSGTTSGGQPKLKQSFAYGRTNNWSDPHGHGTHVAGSAAGTGVKSDELEPGTFIRGVAHDAQLVMQSTLNSSGGLTVPNIDTVVFPDAYGAGARVHLNSWGYLGTAGSYTYSSVLADTYTWDHKDFAALFSAGNDGVDADADGVIDLGSVLVPATAKNVISVGASENDRPVIPTTWDTAAPGSYQPPIQFDKLADNPGGMAPFSSRGPCADGRIKPDVVAPGVYVVSARSSVSAHTVVLPSKYGEYGSALDPYYRYDSGTSMSCPLAAGAAVLVREFLEGNGFLNPSSALIKGLIIAGAADMTPGQYSGAKKDVTARPDYNQGWGRVDVKGALYPDPPKRMLHDDYAPGIVTGGTRRYAVTVSDASVPVRVNVVWTDYPGVSGVSPNIVNDLDLVVTAPDGTVYHGNVYSGSVSVPDAASFDRLNNVEGVTVPASSMTAGTLTVDISGYDVPEGPQPFAVVFSGGFTLSSPSVSGILPTSGVNNVSTPVTVSGGGFLPGASVYVGGAECAVSSVTPTAIYAVVPAGIAPGMHDVRVVNPDVQSAVLSGGFTSVQDQDPPSPPQGLAASPGDGSVNLRWSHGTEPDLAGYRVYFDSYSTAAGLVDTHRLSGLTNGISHAIYIKAEDAAGNLSQPSATVSATPFATVSELPHYDWDLSPAWTCGPCHVTPSGGLLPPGFDYATGQALCLSCHNAASVAHGSAVKSGRSHAVMSNVTAGDAVMPSFGSATTGEYSDAMYSHLKDGGTVVCATCHNPMRKPHDTGRAWELLDTQDGLTYTSSRGGWWDQGHASVKAYRYGSLGTPTLAKEREGYRLPDSGFAYDEDAGTLTFAGATSGYVYLSLDEPYLRAPGADNTLCLDCHPQYATHRLYNCLACHGMHAETGSSLVRKSVRRPDGSSAPVVFTSSTGMNSFADGDGTYDGICEVCHTKTAYYRNDGSVLDNHTSTGLDYSGTDCAACHTHAAGFEP